MSARAAWRLEQLGFTNALDYTTGRHDWESAGLAVEGTDERAPIVADAISYDHIAVGLNENVGSARSLLGEQTRAIVTNDAGIVLGVMRKESWDHPDDDLVADAMRLGPSTVRPGDQLSSLVERMTNKHVESVIVSDPEGRLIGVMALEKGRNSLRGEVERVFVDCENCPGWWRHRVVG